MGEANDPDYSQVKFRPVVYSGCWAVTWIRTAVVVFEAVTGGQKEVWFRSNRAKKVVNWGE